MFFLLATAWYFSCWITHNPPWLISSSRGGLPGYSPKVQITQRSIETLKWQLCVSFSPLRKKHCHRVTSVSCDTVRTRHFVSDSVPPHLLKHCKICLRTRKSVEACLHRLSTRLFALPNSWALFSLCELTEHAVLASRVGWRGGWHQSSGDGRRAPAMMPSCPPWLFPPNLVTSLS